MKKIVFTLLVLSVLVASATIVLTNNDELNTLLESNVEALARFEGEEDFVRNFDRKECWIRTSITGEVSLVYTNPGISFAAKYEPIVCCVVATDMTQCDFAAEDPKCKQYIIRPAH